LSKKKKELHCAIETVNKWIHRYQQTGDVQDEYGRGLKRKTSDNEDLTITSMAKRLRSSSSVEMSTSLKRQGISVSPATVRC
jgi:transposase